MLTVVSDDGEKFRQIEKSVFTVAPLYIHANTIELMLSSVRYLFISNILLRKIYEITAYLRIQLFYYPFKYTIQ